MAQQAIVIYISQDGGEIDSLTDLVGGAVTELDWVGSLNGEDIPVKIRLAEEEEDDVPVSTTCRHCGRGIGFNEGEGWVDPEATGDDYVWRNTCDSHDTFTAEHEPTPVVQSLEERTTDPRDDTGWVDGVPQFWDSNSKTWMAITDERDVANTESNRIIAERKSQEGS